LPEHFVNLQLLVHVDRLIYHRIYQSSKRYDCDRCEI